MSEDGAGVGAGVVAGVGASVGAGVTTTSAAKHVSFFAFHRHSEFFLQPDFRKLKSSHTTAGASVAGVGASVGAGVATTSVAKHVSFLRFHRHSEFFLQVFLVVCELHSSRRWRRTTCQCTSEEESGSSENRHCPPPVALAATID